MAKGVQVDLIVDPKKAIEGIGKLESRASGVTDTLGRIGKVAAGALAGLAAASAAGAVALGAAVVKGFSEYEQLAGGVTKLFGEADQTVQAFAANAATSAGLNANQYLETVTSFSASLIAGLGGDQAKAALLADTAITDMADNANTFGSSIESIQLAYQGFAKQNYTMLDNLKLGYGGTQAEMARLINDSGVLGDSMKVTAKTVNDVSFDKMIEAIHVVQTNMGIAGTTAKEAAETIQGSFDSTKASIQNLIVGLGDADADFDKLVGNVAENAENLISNVAPVIGRIAEALPKVVPTLISAVEKLLPTLIPVAADIISSILNGLVRAAPSLVQGAVPVIMNLVTGIVGMLPTILEAGIVVLLSLIDGITQALPELIPAAVAAVTGLVMGLVDNLPLLIESGIELLIGLALGLVEAIPQLLEKVPVIINKLVTSLIGAIPQLISAGVQLLLALVQNLPAIIQGIVSVTPTIVDAIVDALMDPKFWKAMGDAGLQLIRGLWEGIKGAGAWLWKQISGFFNGIVNNIKGFFGIKSPSTLFAGFGEFMVEGLEKGLTGPNHLDRITTDLSRQVSDGFQGSLAATAKATVQTTGGAVAGRGGDVHLHLHGFVGGADTGRAAVKALQEYVRTGGTGLRAVLG